MLEEPYTLWFQTTTTLRHNLSTISDISGTACVFQDDQEKQVRVEEDTPPGKSTGVKASNNISDQELSLCWSHTLHEESALQIESVGHD